MILPYYFTDEILKRGFKIDLESHNINLASFILKFIPKFADIGYETRYINKILNELVAIYARLISQYKFKNHIIFSASFYKIKEEDQRSDETDIFIYLNINHNSA